MCGVLFALVMAGWVLAVAVSDPALWPLQESGRLGSQRCRVMSVIVTLRPARQRERRPDDGVHDRREGVDARTAARDSAARDLVQFAGNTGTTRGEKSEETIHFDQQKTKTDGKSADWQERRVDFVADCAARVLCVGMDDPAERRADVRALFTHGAVVSEAAPPGTERGSGTKDKALRDNKTLHLRTAVQTAALEPTVHSPEHDVPEQSLYRVTWSTTELRTKHLDVGQSLLPPGSVDLLPFYLRLVGGSQVHRGRPRFRYVSGSLGTLANPVLDTGARWKFCLDLSTLKSNVTHVLAVADSAENVETYFDQSKRQSTGRPDQQVACRSLPSGGLLNSTRVFVYSLGDRSRVPFPVLERFITYSQLCGSGSNTTSQNDGWLVCFLLQHLHALHLVYWIVVLLTQLWVAWGAGTKWIHCTATVLNILAFLKLYVPGIVVANDVQGLSATLYIFHWESMRCAWSAARYVALVAAWTVYPAVTYIVGFIPAVLFIADLWTFGHFHPDVLPWNCACHLTSASERKPDKSEKKDHAPNSV